jgi:hypothetical protein
MITRPEADYLAALIRIHRPHWDHLVIMDNLILVGEHRDLADVAHAAIRTAQDPAMLTPQALKFVDSPHWRPTVRETHERATPFWEDTARLQEIDRCPYCDPRGRLDNGNLCTHDDPKERAQRARDRAQAALAQVRATRTNALNEETQ